MQLIDPEKHTSFSRVPIGSSYFAQQSTTTAESSKLYHRPLLQHKQTAIYTPVTITKKQTWEDMIARTMTANQLIKTDAISKKRYQNENLKRTKRILQPELQEPVDVLNNKITGCSKKTAKF